MRENSDNTNPSPRPTRAPEWLTARAAATTATGPQSCWGWSKPLGPALPPDQLMYGPPPKRRAPHLRGLGRPTYDGLFSLNKTKYSRPGVS